MGFLQQHLDHVFSKFSVPELASNNGKALRIAYRVPSPTPECVKPLSQDHLARPCPPSKILRWETPTRHNTNGDVVVDKQSARSDAPNAGLVPQETVVLLVDLVESVRLMREHEASCVRRWADFVRVVNSETLPRHNGTMVKSLGDGFMARFETVPVAVNAAAEMHQTIASRNGGMPEDQHFHLRAGVNAATAWSDGIDIYGTGVNLAARLATLAGPGETIASASAHEQLAVALASLAHPGETISSAAARDELTHNVDGSCEDIGECYLKHFDKPIRAYRIGPASPHPSFPGPAGLRNSYGTNYRGDSV